MEGFFCVEFSIKFLIETKVKKSWDERTTFY